MPLATDRKQSARKTVPAFSSAERHSLRRRLLAWYRKHARDLPWRHTRDPYCIWISEVMLQQTQVATVREYYARFIAALPTVEYLAGAREQQVLRLWEGMGYYRRARQLHAAAKEIVSHYGGSFPSDVNSLLTLPGIGRYTAGAIASIAFGQRAAILEANTVRLLSRLIAYRDDPTSPAGQRGLWQVAAELLPRNNVAQFNQALMELGALVCKPTEPRCQECPLSMLCAANAAGLQQEIPRPKARVAATELREAAVVIRRNGRVLMRQCGQRERWAGLWDFPRFQLQAEGPLFAGDEIRQKVLSQTGIECQTALHIKTIKHGVTRFRITLQCYEALYAGGRARSTGGSSVAWVKLADLDALPLSTTGRAITKLLTKPK
jgi:A/G-specific adenine glycosylase